MAAPLIQVMDTTLRDGEQTPNVAYAPAEKLELARLLLDAVQVDRIEIAQVFVSEGEAEAVTGAASWSKTRCRWCAVCRPVCAQDRRPGFPCAQPGRGG